ncbi:hypothetical protein HDU96_005559, partial [Phlyctochytrium bullatum]
MWGVEWFLRNADTFLERNEEIEEAEEGGRLDLRSFLWACQTRQPDFSLDRFLELLAANPKGEEMDLPTFRTVLSQAGVDDVSDEEFLAVFGILTGDDGEPGLITLREWIKTITTCGVKPYLYTVQRRWREQPVEGDARLAFQACATSDFYVLPGINAEANFLFSFPFYPTAFLKHLVSVKEELNVQTCIKAFAAGGLTVTAEEVRELVYELTGSRERPAAILEDLASTAQVVQVDEMVSSLEAFEEKTPAPSAPPTTPVVTASAPTIVEP